MSKIFKNSTLESINYFMALSFCLILPFNNRYITYFIIPWLIISIAIAILKKISLREILSLSIFYLIFYSVSVISLVYTRNINYGIKNLETMISLIFMPFLLVVLKKTMTRGKINYLIDSYIAGLLIYIVISLVVLFVRWDIKDITSYIKTDTLTGTASYLHLSPILQKSYISIYLVWAIALLIDRLFNSKYQSSLAFSIVMLVVFSLFTFALGSRAALLTLAVILIFYIFKFLKRYPLWFSIPVTFAVIVLLIAGLFRFTRIGETISALKKDSQSDKRIPQWISAIEVVRNAPVFGYGVGDGLDELVRQHKENGFEEDVKLRSNAHNQFLETATQTGIFGVVSLILILLVPLAESIKRKQDLLFLIASIIFINMLFESLLVRLAGVLFIGFWMNYTSIIQSDPEL